MDFLAKVIPIASGRPRLISFSGAFHGMTIGSGGISGHAALSKPIPNGHITKVPFPNPNQCSWGPCKRSGCSLKCLDFIENEVLSVLSPPEETAAIFAEIVQSDSGEIIPPANYFPALRELCDMHGIWLVLDEIKTGLGRTGKMSAFEKYGIQPDALAISKPLGGGLPISAVVARAEIFDADLYTAYTLGGSPLSFFPVVCCLLSLACAVVRVRFPCMSPILFSEAQPELYAGCRFHPGPVLNSSGGRGTFTNRMILPFSGR